MSQARPHPYVVEEHLFRLVVELELRKALRIQYAFSVLTIVRQLPQGMTVSPGAVDVSSIVGPTSRVIRAADLIGLVPTSPAVRILLVGAYIDEVDLVIQRIRAEIPPEVPLRFGVSCFPATDTTAAGLLGRADFEAGLPASG
jgi:hypothetical protein